MTKSNKLTALTVLTAAVLVGPAAAQTVPPVTEPVSVTTPAQQISEDTTLDSAATETLELDSTDTSTSTSTATDGTNMSTTMTTAAPAELPDSALAVRQILARLGLLSGPAPATTAVLTDVGVPENLQALLPGATWTPAGGLLVGGVAVSSSAAVGTDMMGADMATTDMTGMDMTTPVVTDSTVTDSMTTDLSMTEPVLTESEMTEPVTEPAVTEPAATEPGVTPPLDVTAPTADIATTDTAADTADVDVAEGDNILSALEADGRFGTFLELVELADLQSAILSDDYTLLVPTDAAFEALDPAVLEAVRADAELAGYILGYHVVPGLQTPGTAPLTNVYSEALPADLKVSGEAITAGGSQAYAVDQVIIPADLQEQE